MDKWLTRWQELKGKHPKALLYTIKCLTTDDHHAGCLVLHG